MANPQGHVTMNARGQDYTLFLGMSVLADIQEKHGLDALEKLDPPKDAPEGWVPDLRVVGDLFLGALQRHHADVADRWLVDDLMSENANGVQKLMGHSFPDGEAKKPVGNGKKSSKAA